MPTESIRNQKSVSTLIFICQIVHVQHHSYTADVTVTLVRLMLILDRTVVERRKVSGNCKFKQTRERFS